jgi:unsaturated rhamnogalacturonyl hydrolase
MQARDQVLAIMHKVNDHQRNNPKDDPRHEWVRATWYTGVMAFYRATGDERVLTQAIDWSEESRWMPGPEEPGANRLTCTQTYLEIYFVRRDPKMIAPTIAWIDSGEPNSPSGSRLWYLGYGDRYADSLYVGPPALAMLAQATGDERYLAIMDEFYWDVHSELFDAASGLFYRDRHFIGEKSGNGKKVIWSRGNGWVIAGIPRILEHLPPRHPTRGRYEELFRTMAAAVVRTQGKDGLWRTNLEDPRDFPPRESSGSGFFCYALAWGINNGLLPRDAYLPSALKAWEGLLSCLSPEGRVQWCQVIGDRPVTVKRKDTHEYATGVFLLAGSEMLRLAP